MHVEICSWLTLSNNTYVCFSSIFINGQFMQFSVLWSCKVCWCFQTVRSLFRVCDARNPLTHEKSWIYILVRVLVHSTIWYHRLQNNEFHEFSSCIFLFLKKKIYQSHVKNPFIWHKISKSKTNMPVCEDQPWRVVELLNFFLKNFSSKAQLL